MRTVRESGERPGGGFSRENSCFFHEVSHVPASMSRNTRCPGKNSAQRLQPHGAKPADRPHGGRAAAVGTWSGVFGTNRHTTRNTRCSQRVPTPFAGRNSGPPPEADAKAALPAAAPVGDGGANLRAGRDSGGAAAAGGGGVRHHAGGGQPEVRAGHRLDEPLRRERAPRHDRPREGKVSGPLRRAEKGP